MQRRAARTGMLGVLLICLAGGGLGIARAEWETVGRVVTLPERPGPHWF